MAKVSGIVEAVGIKPVNTRAGTKDTFSFKVGGNWYKTGFKNSGVSKGQTVNFEYEAGKWGNDVDIATLVLGGSATPPTVFSPVTPAPRKEYRNGSFPIDPLDGQRSILRQNAVTNARELYCYVGMDSSDVDAMLERIISMAKRIEAYTSGDEDLEAAKAATEE